MALPAGAILFVLLLLLVDSHSMVNAGVWLNKLYNAVINSSVLLRSNRWSLRSFISFGPHSFGRCPPAFCRTLINSKCKCFTAALICVIHLTFFIFLCYRHKIRCISLSAIILHIIAMEEMSIHNSFITLHITFVIKYCHDHEQEHKLACSNFKTSSSFFFCPLLPSLQRLCVVVPPVL